MASIKDVAKKAGVGVGTVSRAMNGTGYVSAETKKKIEEAIDELKYKPNELARNLFRSRTGIIGVVIPNIEHPFFSRLIKHIEIALYQYGYKTMVCNTIGNSNREQQYMDMLERNIVDGIITGAHSLGDEEYLRIQRPIVAIDRDLGPTIPLIHSDHAKVGRLAAELMIRSGCRNVLQISGSMIVNTPSNMRHITFKETLEKHGIKVTSVEGAWNMLSYEYYQDIVKRVAEEYPDVDGMFSADMSAVCYLNMALEKGIKVPEDLKIVGYDATFVTKMTAPKITAIDQDISGLAKCCVKTIMDLIEGKENINYHQILDVEICMGGTTI